MAFFILMAAQTAGEASVLHWTTRILSLNCDNHPVVQRRSTSEIPQLAYRQEDSDVLTATRFEAERPVGHAAKLILGVCNGEVHILPAQTPGMLKITVQLGASLHHEQTPKSYLQKFEISPELADIEWKLPSHSRPEIYVYLPEDANLDLNVGNSQLEVKGNRGNKRLDVGRGKARLYVASGNTDFSRITVDVAMGSFADLRPEGKENHKIPLHEEIQGSGASTATVSAAMGKVEIVPE